MHSNPIPARRILRLANATIMSMAILATSSVAGVQDVLGFESTSSWSRTTGDAVVSSDRTQGQSSLLVSRFWYTELLTPKLSWTAVTGTEMALDLKIPSGTSWGSIALVATAPSAQVWEQTVGQVNLGNSNSPGWSTLRFPVPSALQQVFRGARSDLQFKLRLNLPWNETGYAFDNLRFLDGAPVASKVEIRTPSTSGTVYLSVNGQRHRVAYRYQSQSELEQWRDVSSWFHGGQNSVRLQANNYDGPASFQFELRVDGVVRSGVVCCSDPVQAAITDGVFYDQPVAVPALNLPAAQTVRVTGAESGKIYLDDEYTGLTSPANLVIPQGTHSIGLGISSDLEPNYTGRFYERQVVVGAQPINLDMETQSPAQGPRNVTRIAILPVRNSYSDDQPRVGVLTPEMVTRFRSQVEATRSKLYVPFSYGLSDWEVTLLPMETSLSLHTATAGGIQDDAWRLAGDPKFAPLFSQYHFVIVLHSEIDAQGIQIPGTGGAAGSGGQLISFPVNWSTGFGSNDPIHGLLHEILHQYEADLRDWHHQYFGIEGLHGANDHGYTAMNSGDTWGGTQEWLAWYRAFMRGQVVEKSSMRAGVELTTIPTSGDYFVGTYSTVRYGLDTPAPR